MAIQLRKDAYNGMDWMTGFQVPLLGSKLADPSLVAWCGLTGNCSSKMWS